MNRKRVDEPKVEVKYFEHLEEVEGKVTDTKRYVVKGQVFVNGVPVGAQFTMSEHILEKFDYEKLKDFRNEILMPLAQVAGKSAEVYAALKSGGASLASGVLKSFKSKAS